MSPLTPYDTDAVYQPMPWPTENGKVDFDNSEGATILTLSTRPSGQPIEPDVTVIDVAIGEGEQAKLILNGRTVWLGTPEWEHPAFEHIRKYVEETEWGNEPGAAPYVYDIGGDLEHVLSGTPWESIEPAGGEARVLADYFAAYVLAELGEGRVE